MALIVGAYLAAVLIAGPQGNFPVNDDWSWAYAARKLAFGHVWQPTGWTGMPLISHAAWGGLFCLAAGDCSYETLRWSTITAAAIALAFAYAAGREIGLTRLQTAVATATLAVNPLLFSQSLTFMTDVTMVALTAAGAFFYLRTLRTRSAGDLAAAVLISVVGVLCRQLALCLPAGYAVAVIVRDGWSARAIVRAVWPAALAAAAFALFNNWMARQGLTPAMYTTQTAQMLAALRKPATLVKNVADVAGPLLCYLGLFCLPAVLFRPLPRRPDLPRAAHVLAAGAMLVALGLAARAIHNSGPMPMSGNVMSAFTLGPQSIGPFFPRPGSAPFDLLLAPGRWIATALAVAGALAIVRRGVLVGAAVLADRSPRPRIRSAQEALILAAACAYPLPLLVLGSTYDRYVLPLLVLAPLIGATWLPAAPASKVRRWGAIALIVLLGLATVAAEHDFMTRSRARWAVVDRALARGVAAGDIDGGFEFDRPPCYNPKPRCSPAQEVRADAAYTVRYGTLPGYRQVDAEAYGLWLPFPQHAVFLLQRERPAAAPAP